MSPRLSIIPAGAVTDRSLEPRDLQVLGLLGCHIDKAGWCRRSQVKMAQQLHCGRSSVQRSLENLVTAGWVEKKRPPWSNEGGQPSKSYMYRVILDRDDLVAADGDDGEPDADESHAETASDEGECPPVGTPQQGISSNQIAAGNHAGGAQQDGHPGAQTYVGTGAQPYVGTKNAPLERPPLELERDARARSLKDRTARFLVKFEARWPTAGADDRQRTAYAAAALDETEQDAALAGIEPFLSLLKRLKRSSVPAGWRYLEEKRWTLLELKGADIAAEPKGEFPADSPQGKAIAMAYRIGHLTDLFHKTRRRGNIVYFGKPVTPRLLALADAPPRDAWPTLDRQQAGAWDGFVRDVVGDALSRRRLQAGDSAPWPWPPKINGELSAASPALSEQDADALAGEANR